MPKIMKSALTTPSRSARLTGRNLASSAPLTVHGAYRLEPRHRVRFILAVLASEQDSRLRMLDLHRDFIDSPADLEGLGFDDASLRKLREYMELRGGLSTIAHPRPVHRLRSAQHDGYPLSRTFHIFFTFAEDGVSAELREVSSILGIRGKGREVEEALRDLEEQFDRLVRTKVRVPPHVQSADDARLVAVVNHLIDWDRFREENPPTRPLWGRVEGKEHRGLLPVFWLAGPRDIRERKGVVSGLYLHPRLRELPEGTWFKAAVREYPNRIVWDEPPYKVPDPNDPVERRRAWEAIPVVHADEPDVWPLAEQADAERKDQA
jgi:hypothetical protein